MGRWRRLHSVALCRTVRPYAVERKGVRKTSNGIHAGLEMAMIRNILM